MSKHWFLIALAFLLLPQVALGGYGVTHPQVLCDQFGSNCQALIARFDLEDGTEATLRLDFVGADSLSEDSFEVSASLVDPRDPQLLSRLPRDTFIPSDFPVLAKIEPTSGSNLSFRRNWSLELVTENLEFSSHTPYRLFHAPTGGNFQDITVGLGSGSLRLRSAGGRFSEFLIAADLRPIERVVAGKFLRFQSLLASFKLSPSLANELESLLDDARTGFESGDLSGAIARAQALLQRLAESDEQELPNISRPGSGQAAAGGALLSSAITLRHSLIQARQSLEQPPGGFTRKLVQGDMEVDVSVSFRQAFVVDPEDLDIEAQLVDVHDPGLLARLPPGVHVPEEFPVLVRINPRSDQDLAGALQTSPSDRAAFRGSFEIELRTDSLSFEAGTPLRLFKAPDGGAFEDITRTFGLGSLRLAGNSGDFSDFLIASDGRDIGSVIDEKLEDLAELAGDPGGVIPDETQAEIEDLVGDIEEAIDNDMPEDAVAPLEELEELLESDEEVPSVWRPDEEELNVGGQMLAITGTLMFSIEQSLSQDEFQPGDVNLDGTVDLQDLFLLIDLLFG